MKRRDFLKRLIEITLASSNLGVYSESIQQPKIKSEDLLATGIKNIYLTIDDGPGKYMGEILEKINKRKGKVVFYIVGEHYNANKTGQTLVKKAIEYGHIIANHSYSHPNFNSISLDSAKIQIQKTDEIIEKAYSEVGIKREVKLFRFPGGSAKKSVIPFLETLRYRPIRSWDSKKEDDWNIDTLDWKYGNGIDGEKIMNICRKTKEGDVVLVHDQPRGNYFTANRIIPYYLNEKEYKLILPA
ncbi:MAG: polysaccharide deacetylase family protein [Candidatus Pacearchaeota archaeon]